MDLVADMLVAHLKTMSLEQPIDVELLRPSLKNRGRGIGRFVNRFWDYPLWLRRKADAFDVFHIIDHSYAHLVHVLPAAQTVVTCHDVDAFMPLIQPQVITSRLPKVLTRLVLSGMRKAARVSCVSRATYDEVHGNGLVEARRLAVIPNGAPTGFGAAPVPLSDAGLDPLLGARDPGMLELLHVGTTIPRKRIDLLLNVVAAVKALSPAVRLLKAGGAFTSAQNDLIKTMGLEEDVVQLPFLATDQLAALYRRADMVLLTSDREGFGLPLIEAMACGTPVIATDLKVLREVGGEAALYCPLGDIEVWRDTILGVARDRQDDNARSRWRTVGIEQAAKFSWDAYAEAMLSIYQSVATSARSHGVQAAWANGS